MPFFPDLFLLLPAFLAIYFLLSAILFTSIWFWQRFRPTASSKLKNVPGPKSSSFIFGSLREIWAEDVHSRVERWVEKYGHVVKYTGLFGQERLFIADSKASNHILTHSDEYSNADGFRWVLSRAIGQGRLVVEANKHNHQGKIANPSEAHALTEIAVQNATVLTEDAECTRSGEKSVDAVPWSNRTTLDIIGFEGLNFKYSSIHPNVLNELNQALFAIFSGYPFTAAIIAAKMFIPFLLPILLSFCRDSVLVEAQKTANKISRELLSEYCSTLLGIDQKGDGRKPSELFGASLAKEEVTDSEVISQLATLFAAGHETTSYAIACALYSLCIHPDVQTRLRNELLQLESPTPTMDELNSLTYLDWFVKKTLRYHSPLTVVTRCATQDNVIPLSRPYTDTKGFVHDAIRIKKGQRIEIPILPVNVDTELWGSDALEFKPERWKYPPETISGVWSNLLSFDGPGARIGHRFSVMDMKATLFYLVRALEFTLAVPEKEIQHAKSLIGRPSLRRSSGLPVNITLKRNRRDS